MAGLNLPVFKGITPPAVNHFIDNWIVSGQLDNPEHLKATIEADNKIEENTGYFLDWVKRHYVVESIYYPLCGWHTTPMYVFGQENIVYLSNDDKHQYLEDIGTGLRVKSDAIDSPFADHIFDAVFLRFSDSDFSKNRIGKLITELKRVVKPDGLFLLDLGSMKGLAKYWERELQPAELPDDVGKLINCTKSSGRMNLVNVNPITI